jgi:hypothetical protein
MKIKVYTTINESYRYGDLDYKYEIHFISEELRDDYFENVLRKGYIENEHLEEYEENNFESKNKDDQKWCYSIGKKEEEIEIIDKKIW